MGEEEKAHSSFSVLFCRRNTGELNIKMRSCGGLIIIVALLLGSDASAVAVPGCIGALNMYVNASRIDLDSSASYAKPFWSGTEIDGWWRYDHREHRMCVVAFLYQGERGEFEPLSNEAFVLMDVLRCKGNCSECQVVASSTGVSGRNPGLVLCWNVSETDMSFEWIPALYFRVTPSDSAGECRVFQYKYFYRPFSWNSEDGVETVIVATLLISGIFISPFVAWVIWRVVTQDAYVFALWKKLLIIFWIPLAALVFGPSFGTVLVIFLSIAIPRFYSDQIMKKKAESPPFKFWLLVCIAISGACVVCVNFAFPIWFGISGAVAYYQSYELVTNPVKWTAYPLRALYAPVLGLPFHIGMGLSLCLIILILLPLASLWSKNGPMLSAQIREEDQNMPLDRTEDDEEMNDLN